MYMYDVKIDPSVTDTANPSGRTMRGGGSRVWHDVKSGIPLRVYFVCSFIAFNGQIHTYTTSTAAANSLAVCVRPSSIYWMTFTTTTLRCFIKG